MCSREEGHTGVLTCEAQYFGPSVIPLVCASQLEMPISKPPTRVMVLSLGADKDRTKHALLKVPTRACISICWERQMEEMTGKAIISSGLPLCLDSKEMNTKFHHRLKCDLNILENTVLFSEIRAALLATT